MWEEEWPPFGRVTVLQDVPKGTVPLISQGSFYSSPLLPSPGRPPGKGWETPRTAGL